MPLRFLKWANTHIGGKAAPSVSRVILEIESGQEDAVLAFLNRQSYETNQEKLAILGVARSLRIALYLISVFGIVLILVSLLTMMLIGQLLISQARHEIQLLHHLGFTDVFLTRCYVKVMLPVITIPFVLAGTGVFVAGFTLFTKRSKSLFLQVQPRLDPGIQRGNKTVLVCSDLKGIPLNFKVIVLVGRGQFAVVADGEQAG